MDKTGIFEGEIIYVSGKHLKEGDAIRMVVIQTAMSYKDGIVLLGNVGFKGYPSENTYLELIKRIEKGVKLECVISGTKKEGVYNALFRPVIN